MNILGFTVKLSTFAKGIVERVRVWSTCLKCILVFVQDPGNLSRTEGWIVIGSQSSVNDLGVRAHAAAQDFKKSMVTIIDFLKIKHYYPFVQQLPKIPI